MDDSKITIAIPFYNAEQFLAQAIDSVIHQTYEEWRLLLVDDGSSDSSLIIAKEYAEKDSRITVISDGKNRNLGYRLNQIASFAKTEYLARMDADDIMHPRRIAEQIKILQNNSGIDVLGTNAYTIDENNKISGIRLKRSGDQYLMKVDGFIHPTIMAKTEWFKANPYDEQALRVEDMELWYRTNKKFDFRVINEPLFFYREIGENYYKKYFLANISKEYIFKKYPNSKFWKLFYVTNFIKGIIFKLFNVFRQEKYLINRRNQVVFKKKIQFRDVIK